MLDPVGIAIALAGVSTWKLAACTLFARDFERQCVDELLTRHGVTAQNLMAAELTARQFRLRLVPLWLIAAVASWAWLISVLIGKQ